jgi:SAM-dependent methyltransferase
MSAARLAPREGTRPIHVDDVREYWNTHVHDTAMSRSPIGSREFFDDLAQYRFEKLAYLPALVDFAGYRDRRVLEIGCGIGIDLVRFAQHGARVTGIDVSPRQVELARANLGCQRLDGEVRVMDGERLEFPAESFDLVYAHGVLPYARDPGAIVRETARVLRVGGEAVLMVYNRYSWLRLLSVVAGVELEHERAPYFRLHSRRELRRLVAGFPRADIVAERFPVRSRLHHGGKAAVYNGVFVGLFNALPRSMVRRFGWHLVARAVKEAR